MSNVLHIGKSEKFFDEFIPFITSEFKDLNHVFYLEGDWSKHIKLKKEISNFSKLTNFYSLILSLPSAEKIILHGMFSNVIVLLLLCVPSLLSKTVLLPWGGDIYKNNSNSLPDKVKRFFRGRLLRGIRFTSCAITGDIKFLEHVYNVKLKNIFNPMYLSNVVGDSEYFPLGSRVATSLNVMIGHSAFPINNHVAVFEEVKIRIPNCRVFCPLSYGNTEYAHNVKMLGDKIFGSNFVPLTSFMPPNDYYNFLKTIDIAIFDSERQIAASNIYHLLGYGKSVYINNKSTIYQQCLDLGLYIRDSHEIGKNRFDEEDLKKNVEIIKSIFSKEGLVDSWKNLFEA